MSTTFGTLWHGPRLSAFEAACLHSFVRLGHEITLFCYEPVAGVPKGVVVRDATEIVSPDALHAFIVDGQPSISHFSDYFRYRMFQATPLTWVDTDILLLRSWAPTPGRTFLTRETASSINNAVMRVASDEPWLPELIRRAEALVGTQMRWGETGPRLITSLVARDALLAQAGPPERFYPIHWDDFWKVFLPERADECRAACADAYTLHLWNNVVDRLGFWKDYLPPAGSYLHTLFVEAGAESYFHGVFPLRNTRQLVENWQSRQTGQHLGIGNVIRQLLPSIRRTLRHYAG